MRTTVTGSGYIVTTSGVGPFTNVTFGATVNNAGSSAVVDGGGSPAIIITNSGSISSTAATGAGVFLSSTEGGTVVNQNTIFGAAQGVNISAGPGNVTNNSGSITSGGIGVRLNQGGAVINRAGATISGGSTAGVSVANGTVTNDGNINGIPAAAAAFIGVQVTSGTTATIVTNNGSITGIAQGVRVDGDGAVTNSGLIHATSTAANMGNGVFFSSKGGTVTNAATGSIIADAGTGVLFATVAGAAPATVNNRGSITGGTSGVRLGSGGSVINNAGATISGGSTAGVVITSGTVTNDGAINGLPAAPAAFIGVQVTAGTVATLITNTGTITGVAQGVRVDGDGAVTNSGTIRATSTVTNFGNGVFFSTRGGTLTNTSTGSIIGDGNSGVLYAAGAGPATVDNSGGISGAATGVRLGGGGALINRAGATISAGSVAAVSTAGGSVINDGSITGTAAAGANFVGVLVGAGAAGVTVTNNTSGQIIGVDQGVRIDGEASIVNSGLIHGTSTVANHGNGIFFSTKAGTVTNTASGRITGDTSGGIFVAGAAGVGAAVIDNAGVISGGVNGVQLGSDVLGDGGTITNTGVITGVARSGVAVFGPGTADIENQAGGRINGLQNGVQLGSGTVGGGGTVTNSGEITGTTVNGVVVFAGAASVANNAGATISGGGNGVQFAVNATGSVENSGMIQAAVNSGILMQNGGVVTNHAGATIENIASAAISGDQYGVLIGGQSGTVLNEGLISSAVSNGVGVTNGGSVTNDNAAAVIRGERSGVFMPNGGIVDNNFGLIEGVTDAGVVGSNGATVNSRAVITGSLASVRFEAGANTLNLLGGSDTNGNVQMGSGADLTNVFAGADIADVALFHGGAALSTLNFDAYVGDARAVQAWQTVNVVNGADVTFSGADIHQAGTFNIEDGARLAFSTQTGLITGDVNNSGTLDYSVGAGSAAYRIASTVTNSGVILLGGPAGTPNAAGDTLTVTNYVGQGGHMAFNTFLGDDGSASDRLVIDGGTGTGATILDIANTTGGGALTVADGILVVDAQSGATTSTDAFSLGGRVAAGPFEYGLYRGGASNADSWFLRSTLQPSVCDIDPQAPGCGDANTDPDLPNYRPEVPTDIVAPALASRFGLAMIDSRPARSQPFGAESGAYGMTAPDRDRQPANEIWCKDPARNFRCTPTPEQNAAYVDAPRSPAGWARLFGEGGEADHGASSVDAASLAAFTRYGPAYDYRMGGFQAGVDVWGQANRDGSTDAAGLFVGAGRVEADVKAVYGGDAGKTSMNGYAFGGYYTHRDDAGWYIDATAQTTFFDNIKATSMPGVSLQTKGWGVAASLEGGAPLALSSGWVLTPQAQAIWQRVSIDDSRDDFGLIGFADADAVYGRVGAELTKATRFADDRKVTFVARANLWSDFGEDAETTFAGLNGQNTVAFTTNLGGTWGELGLGADVELNNTTNLSGRVSWQSDFKGDVQAIGGNIGVRVNW